MKIRFSSFGILFLFLSLNAFAAVELSGNFGYGKTVYGAQKENDIVNRTYSGSLAFYFAQRTAIEFNFYHNRETTTNRTVIPISGTDLDITELQNKVHSNVYGVGLRQALAGRESLIRPLLSLGYAKQMIYDVTEYSFYNNDTNASFKFNDGETKSRSDSVFATFTLQIRITQGLSLNGSVQTVFPAFDFDLASDNIKYSAGFTWIF